LGRILEQVKKDRNFLKRIEKILKDIERNGYIGIGKPEPLKYRTITHFYCFIYYSFTFF